MPGFYGCQRLQLLLQHGRSLARSQFTPCCLNIRASTSLRTEEVMKIFADITAPNLTLFVPIELPVLQDCETAGIKGWLIRVCDKHSGIQQMEVRLMTQLGATAV